MKDNTNTAADSQPAALIEQVNKVPQFAEDYAPWEKATEPWEREWVESAKASNARLKEQAPRICQQYKIPCDYDLIRDIDRIERSSAVCKECGGLPCRKSTSEFYREVPVYEDGKIKTALVACQFGKMRNFDKNLKKANLPRRYLGKTFTDYQVTEGNERAVKVAKWHCDNLSTKSLYLYGGTGTGKTFLASLIAQRHLQEGSVIFGDVPALLDEIKQTFDGAGSAYEVIRRYSTCRLLILDDLGTGKVTDWNVGVLYQVINARYNEGLPLIVTSNYDLNDLRDRLTVKDKNGVIVDDFASKRIVSRLHEMCLGVHLGDRDKR